jgi:ankyrin repeat protein
MYWAVKHGNLPAVRALLEVLERELRLSTNMMRIEFLHYAANPQANPKPNPKVVKALIEAGADVNVQAVKGDTALILAISPTFDHPDPHLAITPRANVPNIIELIKAGADVNLANCLGDTPLHLAVSR